MTQEVQTFRVIDGLPYLMTLVSVRGVAMQAMRVVTTGTGLEPLSVKEKGLGVGRYVFTRGAVLRIAIARGPMM
jgi:hypothetical protein